MELINTRKTFTINSTIGELTLDGKFICYTMEPTDRGLDSSMALDEIKQKKVFGHTAIPVGSYELIMEAAPGLASRFHWLPTDTEFPLLGNVSDYEGVFIHPGNYPKDTEGCNMLGMTRGIDFIGSTQGAWNVFITKFSDAIKAGGVKYTIVRDQEAYNNFLNKNK